MQKVYLITSDLRALPVFFPRKHIITVEERSGDVKNFGVYLFDEVAYAKVVANTIKEAK